MSAHTEALKQARHAMEMAIYGSEFKSIMGEEPAWHIKSMPSSAALTKCSEAISAIDAALSLPDPSAAPVVPQWLPIESAPRDGTEFLGWTRKVGALVLLWSDERWSDGMSRFDRDPTHWMPLPPAPQQGEQANG